MQDDERKKAVLVAVPQPRTDDAELEASLTELERLVTTLGYRVVGRVVQTRQSPSAAAVLGEGKLEELAQLTGGTGRVKAGPSREPKSDADEDEAREIAVDLVAVDREITPSQLRNLERAAGTTVLDRTGVIIEIFYRHARSREARLEVEIARLTYEAPRLRESPRGKERQHFRGSGDSALELDRRRVRDRIAELKAQLEAVQREQAIRRGRRRQARRVALVGYTNAGKSSLMRALTGSQVLVQDKLFATLDTTVRALAPEAHPRILVSDTVGFIKNLPHDLIASFKSTLDEAAEASLLLQIVDASDPNWRSQLQVTSDVLGEIGAAEIPRRLVMNKIDRLTEAQREALAEELPDAWFVSAHRKDDVAVLRDRIVAFFEAAYVEAEFVVPYDRQHFVSEMHELGRVLTERYENHGVVVRVRTDPETADRLKSRMSASA